MEGDTRDRGAMQVGSLGFLGTAVWAGGNKDPEEEATRVYLWVLLLCRCFGAMRDCFFLLFNED